MSTTKIVVTAIICLLLALTIFAIRRKRQSRKGEEAWNELPFNARIAGEMAIKEITRVQDRLEDSYDLRTEHRLLERELEACVNLLGKLKELQMLGEVTPEQKVFVFAIVVASTDAATHTRLIERFGLSTDVDAGMIWDVISRERERRSAHSRVSN